MKKRLTLLLLAFFFIGTAAWAGIPVGDQPEVMQAETEAKANEEKGSEVSDPSVASMLGIDVVLVDENSAHTGLECVAVCFDEFSDCVSQCVPPDFDGHPTWTACKLSCRQDLSACRACC